VHEQNRRLTIELCYYHEKNMQRASVWLFRLTNDAKKHVL